MIDFKAAKNVLDQLKKGEWKPQFNCEYPDGNCDIDIHYINRNGVSLRVASGLFYLKFSNDDTRKNIFIEIPIHLKAYIWFFGLSKFIRKSKKDFEREDKKKDYENLRKKLM